MTRAKTDVYCEIRASDDVNRLMPLELEPEQLNIRRTRPVYAMALFAVTTTLLYADQNLLAPNLSQVAAEFGFSDVE